MKFKGLKREHYTDRWDEAFPIGNGSIGGLIFGNPLEEVIATNHEELFVPLPENNDKRPYNGYKYLDETRRLIHEGKFKEATLYYLKGLSEEGAPYNTIIWTNPYETASEIHIDVAHEDKEVISDYVQRLDFRTAESSVSFKLNGESFERKAFVSRSRDIMAIEINKEGSPISLSVSLTPNKEAHNILDVNTYIEDGLIISEVTHAEDESGYVSLLKVVSDGEVNKMDNYLSVEKANHVLLLYTITPWKARMEASKVKAKRMLESNVLNYEGLFKEHEVIHREFFERVSIDMVEDDKEFLNEELRDALKGELTPHMLERMNDYGRYLMIASFGKLPPNLQGIWSGTANPPWSADYTLDENIQMMMWQVLPGGYNGFARCYFDWLESYNDAFRANAKAYYGANGLFAASRVSSDGYHTHYNETWPMCFWTAGAGWLSQVYEDYYEYTGDEAILQRGVRYWKEVVAFYEDFMTLRDGRYEFAPSYSPENTPLGNDSPTAINATMDIAVCKEVYTNLINACKILNIEEENIKKWEKEFSLLPDYAVNEDGAVKEWVPSELKDDYHHRHSSHLYMVFPGREALMDGNEELLKACHEAAKLRLIDGVDAISGWGLAHLANISARLKDSTLWYMALCRLINVFTLDNLFTGHNPHSLFQMDANLGITASVYEMLVFSTTKKVEIMPVMVEKLPYIKVSGLKLRGQAELISLVKENDTVSVEIKVNGNDDLLVIAPDGYSSSDGDTEWVVHGHETFRIKMLKR